MQPKSYMIVTGGNSANDIEPIGGLEVEIDGYLKDGWILYGFPFSHNGRVLQAVVHSDPEKP